MAKKQVNFKLPPDLIEALDAKALQENTNRTELVIQGIRHILGLSEAQSTGVDDCVDRRIDSLEARLHQVEAHRVDNDLDKYQLAQLEARVSQLESQRVEDDIHSHLHALTEQVQGLSSRLAQIQEQKELTKTTKYQTPPEAIASGDQSIKLTLTELAKRLGVDRSNLAKIRKNKTAEELADYTKKRDPEGLGWRFDEAGEAFTSI